ncbi:MAG: DUF2694 domain-containing protein [Mycobacterium sp.]|uniref:ESX-1 secretion-associated protein EspH n=1 Tax=Mycobacterium gordonae TaxID=1778 RepID=A0A1A6B7Z3_MYCGO|nr:hypothetical protein [Mycobacterium gordonae]MBI2698739.1 DUF2694 domain-containing protein [Mycobacterium sp.]OBR98466.1 hypothetical protein A9W98_35515 [Mycobacterium gordonae]PJE16932.1 MAG: DUF2694 domain-containing protein [Mycobacterium sp.]
MIDWSGTDDYLDEPVTLDMYGRPRRQAPTGQQTDAAVNWPADDCADYSSTLDLYGRPVNRVSTRGDLAGQRTVESEVTDLEPHAFPPLAGTTASPESGLAKVANPQGTVAVSADMGGRIHRVDLSAGATSMGEQQLAEEILVIANLARQRARSAQYTLLLDTLAEAPVQDPESRPALLEFVRKAMGVATPEDAAATEAKVFATRYTR